ncbi:hypothetical protein [Gryllotalpicola koreensis]|uniref:DUF4386 domain-containing protein n=1 Tax=Gryllotalpicola koreensis TaxID=993086 RepID=A0ABP7ZS50_9MICO
MLSTPPRSPRLTLAWGGAGIVVATLLPLAWQAIHVFPPAGRAWLNYAWQPIGTTASSAVLVAAFAVLAVGIGKESGIAGDLLAGKIALIMFPSAVLAGDLLNLAPLSPMTYLPASAYDGTGQPDQHLLNIVVWGLEGVVYLGHVALVVASVFVIHAGVLRGAARWGLAALALANVLADLLWQGLLGTGPEIIPILSWGSVALPMIQLAVGVLIVLQARVATVSPRLGVVTP